jgi:hypothetical protein
MPETEKERNHKKPAGETSRDSEPTFRDEGDVKTGERPLTNDEGR